jgi:energy-coupling factor transporter transmembrane protein EcfT
MESVFISIVYWIRSTMGGLGEIIVNFITIVIFLSPLISLITCCLTILRIIESIINYTNGKSYIKDLRFSLLFATLTIIFSLITYWFVYSVFNSEDTLLPIP